VKLQAQAVLRREDRLSPLPLAGVLLARSSAAETPSTPPYQRAARELERLDRLVREATRVEECAAEAAALRGPAGRPHRDHAVE